MSIKFILCLSTLLVMSCGTSKNTTTDNSVAGKPELKVASSKVYDWKNHKDFKIFYSDFKTAFEKNDRDAIFKMLNLPFTNGTILEGNNEVINNRADFDNKFDEIFSPIRIKDIIKGNFVDIKAIMASDDEDAKYMYSENEQVLKGHFKDEVNDDGNHHIFSFMIDSNRNYKLFGIPYRP